MLKKLLIAVLSLLPFVCDAQNDISQSPIPMKNGLIAYEQTISLNTSLPRPSQYKSMLSWFNDTFSNTGGNIITADERSGEINGTGNFKVRTSQTGNYYWIRFAVTIKLSDSTYSFKATNVYEKPIEKGISNEFSKLEYRWWDFRQGHPWSVEDSVLFRGMNNKMNVLMTSLQSKIGKQ
jgi:hypothetical protein